MDVAAVSVAMANTQVRADASLAIMGKVKGLMEQQGQQMMEMLQQSGPQAPHPSLGNVIDLQA
ncbi:YjfB family protein [Virgibacillus ndiopensis]|uniref:YjfB family protein n=1 Tax=Virgibacillus ndiopensis TaxID=2004408 RepID=UPI000C080878|nr:YjfB family protein [Virgibacillus ndiopensis]